MTRFCKMVALCVLVGGCDAEPVSTSDIELAGSVVVDADETVVRAWTTNVDSGADVSRSEVELVAVAADGAPSDMTYNQQSHQYVAVLPVAPAGSEVRIELYRPGGEGDATDNVVVVPDEFQVVATQERFRWFEPVEFHYDLPPDGLGITGLVHWEENGGDSGTFGLDRFEVEPGVVRFDMEDLVGERSPTIIPGTFFIDVTVTHSQPGQADPALAPTSTMAGSRTVTLEFRLN